MSCDLDANNIILIEAVELFDPLTFQLPMTAKQ